jgi:hypothetical protein
LKSDCTLSKLICGLTVPRQHIVRTHTLKRTPQGEEPEGISEEQEEQLKLKAKRSKIRNTEDRWVDIYRFLFPDATRVPIPCGRTYSMPLSTLFWLTREQIFAVMMTRPVWTPFRVSATVCCLK